jgi:membrane-bound metal-dependent hydrolase YbcI (DUF457 family)
VLATAHVLSGALIGRRVRRPAVAAALGVASHLSLDALPHWGVDAGSPAGRRTFMRVAVADGLTLSAALLWVWRRWGTGSELAGALGALLLDMDKPAAEVGVRQLWPDRLHHVHIGIQTGERPHRWPIDVAVAAGSLAALVADRRRGQSL